MGSPWKEGIVRLEIDKNFLRFELASWGPMW